VVAEGEEQGEGGGAGAEQGAVVVASVQWGAAGGARQRAEHCSRCAFREGEDKTASIFFLFELFFGAQVAFILIF
jgi:hypothetical protein